MKEGCKEKNPRFMTWDDYGITRQEYKQLHELCMSGRDSGLLQTLINAAAVETNRMIAAHIVESVTEGKTYEQIEYSKRFGRIACGRTDFYGYRRKFYAVLKRMLEAGNKGEK